MPFKLHIHYYAILREQRGRDAETLTTNAKTPAQLYSDLAAQHGFTLPFSRMRVAINDEFQNGNARLKDGDTIVFIPPVAGG